MADRMPIATGFKFPLATAVNVATKTASTTTAGRIVVVLVFMLMLMCIPQAISKRRIEICDEMKDEDEEMKIKKMNLQGC